MTIASIFSDLMGGGGGAWGAFEAPLPQAQELHKNPGGIGLSCSLPHPYNSVVTELNQFKVRI